MRFTFKHGQGLHQVFFTNKRISVMFDNNEEVIAIMGPLTDEEIGARIDGSDREEDHGD